jgi:uncharacterized protein
MARCAGGTKATVHCRRAIDGATTGHRPASGGARLHTALMALICDTGPLYAAMDEADTDHAPCAELLGAGEEQLVVPAPVVVELEWLASSRLGPLAFDAFLTDVEEGMVRIVDLVLTDYTRVRELCARYADLPLGFVDASVVAVVERLGERKLATLDHRYFRVVRPRHTPSLTLLPDLG